ncbi:MAG: hypothetical protein QW645_03770 [Candidatus Bathyarchaeia archaeon]
MARSSALAKIGRSSWEARSSSVRPLDLTYSTASAEKGYLARSIFPNLAYSGSILGAR